VTGQEVKGFIPDQRFRMDPRVAQPLTAPVTGRAPSERESQWRSTHLRASAVDLTLDVEGFPIERYWHFVYPAAKRLSPAAQAFVEMAKCEASSVLAGWRALSSPSGKRGDARYTPGSPRRQVSDLSRRMGIPVTGTERFHPSAPQKNCPRWQRAERFSREGAETGDFNPGP